MGARVVTRTEFNEACEAVWSEIQYQNALPRRTEQGEAKDVPGFATLMRVYLRKLEDEWSGTHGLNDNLLGVNRKLAAIALRAMVYCGIRYR